MTRVLVLVLALLLLEVALLAPSTGAQSASGGATRLELGQELSIANATLLVGEVTFLDAPLTRLGLVAGTGIDVSEGNLTVCPRETRTQSQGASANPFRGPCRGARTYENPQIRFGGRTNLEFADGFSVVDAPAASMGILALEAGASRTTWVSVLPKDGIGVRPEGENFTFRATSLGASIIVTVDEDQFYFNGTEHTFTFEAREMFTLRGGGMYASLPPRVNVRVGPAAPDAFRSVLAPRVLLDIEEALLGADAREPVSALTGVVGNFTRVPSLLNGALVGRLNGTVAGSPFTPADAAFVRLTWLNATVTRGVLEGEAVVQFTVTSEGFAPAGDDPRTPPWRLAITLWIIAALALVIVPRHATPPPEKFAARHARLLVIPVAFVLWDMIVKNALGTSAFSLYMAGEPRGSIAAFAVFEMAALGFAWLLLATPVSIGVGRILHRFAPKWRVARHLAGAAVVVLATYVWPFAILGLGFRVTKL